MGLNIIKALGKITREGGVVWWVKMGEEEACLRVTMMVSLFLSPCLLAFVCYHDGEPFCVPVLVSVCVTVLVNLFVLPCLLAFVCYHDGEPFCVPVLVSVCVTVLVSFCVLP